jgi:hypothetical protein
LRWDAADIIDGDLLFHVVLQSSSLLQWVETSVASRRDNAPKCSPQPIVPLKSKAPSSALGRVERCASNSASSFIQPIAVYRNAMPATRGPDRGMLTMSSVTRGQRPAVEAACASLRVLFHWARSTYSQYSAAALTRIVVGYPSPPHVHNEIKISGKRRHHPELSLPWATFAFRMWGRLSYNRFAVIVNVETSAEALPFRKAIGGCFKHNATRMTEAAGTSSAYVTY